MPANMRSPVSAGKNTLQETAPWSISISYTAPSVWHCLATIHLHTLAGLAAEIL